MSVRPLPAGGGLRQSVDVEKWAKTVPTQSIFRCAAGIDHRQVSLKARRTGCRPIMWIICRGWN